jgi:pimeloyl-ACP methyl ester carboxylesterase
MHFLKFRIEPEYHGLEMRRGILLVILGAFIAITPMAVPMHAQEPAAHPQEPKRPFPYLDEPVRYSNPSAPDVVLAGTLTKPSSGGPFPAVLLITGAGPQDRDETIATHKPFLVLADYLTRRGIAVLRVDDRGTAESTGNFVAATTQDFASDAEAGVHYLLSRSEIDPKHIGLIGHGEGAIIATMVAANMPQVSFLVLLAGTAVSGEELLLAQTEAAEVAAGVPGEQIEADRKIGKMLYDLVREGKSEIELRQALYTVNPKYKPFLETWQRQLHHLETPWLRFFLNYDPAPALTKVKCPVLALDGEKDLNVVPDQNVPAMKAAFARGHNHDATVRVLPGLNYMFQTAKTGFAWEYPTIQETISPAALEIIGSWIAKHT